MFYNHKLNKCINYPLDMYSTRLKKICLKCYKIKNKIRQYQNKQLFVF